MAYQINKTDGTIIATVADGQVDTLSTDITLIGKNYSGFGEALNENFIKLLENFSGTTSPVNPIKGQIWFDGTENKLKVYSGTAFVPVSSATISATQPSTLGVGDLWFNDTQKQLYFFDGENTILLGPDYSEAQGLSGLQVFSILDSLNQTRVITSLYNNGVLLGIFSKDAFTPKNAIAGYSGDINPGFNQGTLSGMKFDVTATNSEKLGSIDATTYARRDTSNSFAGQVRINTNLGVVFGAGDQGNLYVDGNGNVFLTNSASDKTLVLNVRKGLLQENAVVVDATSRTVKIYEPYTDSNVIMGGSLEIKGDTIIRGTLTIDDGEVLSIKTEDLTVENKNIVMAETGNSVTNSNSIADGGGIILRGTVGASGDDLYDHIFVWADVDTAAASRRPDLKGKAWNSSEDINLRSGKEFKINGVSVINETSLGSGITSIPGVTSFGTQNVVNIGPGAPPVTQLRLENNKIETVANNDDLELEADGTGNIALIGSPRITGLADPIDQTDAASKEYVDDVIETRSLAFSMDLSDGKPNTYIASQILANLAPPAEYRNGVTARILCTTISNSTGSLSINPLVTEQTADFVTPTGTAPALIDISIANATVPAPVVTTTRVIKTFQLSAGAWSFVSEVVLP
jgi:hypothetical protein